MSIIRPEHQLLLRTARVQIEPDDADGIRTLVRNGLDFEYLVSSALRHGMMSLLYWHLNTICPEALPEVTLKYLRDRFYEKALRNLFLAGRLVELLKIFEANGVHAAPYKGPVLAASVYGLLSLREIGDLDILVRKRDVLTVKDLLLTRGYQPEFNLSPEQEVTYLRTECEYNFDSIDRTVHVEIHWEIVPRYFSFQLDHERLWGRIKTTSLCGANVRMLCPEDCLLILCVHGAKHSWDRLVWICDIAQLIGVHPELDWEQIMEQASALGMRRMLVLGLFLANNLLGASLPEAVMHRARADTAILPLVRYVRERLFGDSPVTAEAWKWQSRQFQLRARERWRDRFRYCLRLTQLKFFGEQFR